jgi:hypothetical protein
MRKDSKNSISHLYYPKNLAEAPAYIFGGVDEESDLVFVPDFTKQPKTFVRKVLKFLFVGRIPLSGRLTEWITGYKGYAWLSTLKPSDRLLLNGVTNLRTLRAVAWLTNPAVTRYQYFNNCLHFVYPKHMVAQKTSSMQAMGYHLVTFDPQEAAKYGMKYAEQFYRYPPEAEGSINTEQQKYDFFFCGEQKDRGRRLADLEHTLSIMGYRCLFIVVSSESQRISYQQYLKYTRQSRCIVDIQQEGQTGLTRRPIEALFFKKKLLTANRHISTYDFYRKENIFIIDRDGQVDAANMHHFLDQQPMVDVPVDIKARYEVNHWLRYFDGKTENEEESQGENGQRAGME